VQKSDTTLVVFFIVFNLKVYLIRLQLIIFLLEVRANTTLSPWEGIGTLLKTLKHWFGIQAVSPETWLISPVNAFGEQEAISIVIAKHFNMKIICFIVYVFK